ncbi:hypothetical protein JCM11641_008121 [Rhodosporidiobolus odoratus]
MAIGPQLPPHLADVAKPTDDTHERPEPSTSTTTAPRPPATDEDSDDDYGPALPPDLVGTRDTPPVTGPQLPPPVPGPSKASIGPQLPPHLAGSTSSSSPARSTAGPSLPPGYSRGYSGQESDDDDDFGPMPLPEGVTVEENEGARMFREREERQAEKERRDKEGKGKPQREEWMLVPPKEMDLLTSMDTTKLKSRGFATGKAAASAGKKEGPSNLWTETPAERQQRLQDEMMGKKRKAENAPVEEESDEVRRKRVRDRQLREEVDKHNKSSRNLSLVDQHDAAARANPQKDEDRAPTAIWDRDRDLGMGGRIMDDGKRSDIIKNAKGLGGRFGGGGYL